MKVKSVNRGEARLVDWRGKKVSTGIFKYPVEGAIFLGTEDVVDDDVVDRKYHGGVDKAVYAYSADHYPFWKEQYPALDWSLGMFGENLTIEGLDESRMHRIPFSVCWYIELEFTSLSTFIFLAHPTKGPFQKSPQSSD
ncbi:MAG: MOSC domain-containing protein YiiM [Bacteroidia bacterium]|jgi:MOSC domain-containing protein YiiM